MLQRNGLQKEVLIQGAEVVTKIYVIQVEKGSVSLRYCSLGFKRLQLNFIWVLILW